MKGLLNPVTGQPDNQKDSSMKRITAMVLAGSLVAASLAGAGGALAEQHPHHRAPARHRVVVRHRTVVRRRTVVTHRTVVGVRPVYHWRAGGRIPARDWGRGRRIDYRVYHLRAPPRGYEWREVDGNYVLAAIAGGVIASVLLASH